jgi:hypothetical protein
MSRLPSEYTPYNLSSITATPINGEFRAFGSDYSEEGGEVLYIGSVPLERMVTFKAFFESIKINFQKEVEILKKSSQNFSIIKERVGEFSIDISLNVPAHGANEARNNFAKIVELQRLMMPGDWTRVPASGTTKKRRAVVGASNRTETINPFFVVFFKNIINSGIYYTGNNPINSFEELFNLGLLCYIEEVNYKPDIDAGYFKLEGHLYPKNIKLSLNLKYESLSLTKEKGKTLSSFMRNGHYASGDSSLFPFMLKIGNNNKDLTERHAILNDPSQIDFTKEQMNDIFSSARKGMTNEKLDSYIYISNIRDPSQEKNSTHGLRPPSPKGANRYVLFKPIIEDFSRNVKTKVSIDEKSVNEPVYNHVPDGAFEFESIDYSLKFKVVSTSLQEAKKNAGKIQYLSRMFFKKKEEGGTKFSYRCESRDYQIPKKSLFTHLLFYVPSMIEMPNISTDSTQDHVEMFNRGLPLFLKDMSLDFEIASGFFEEDGKLYPKEYSITMNMMNENPNLIAPYYLSGVPSDEVYTVTPLGNKEAKYFDDDVAYLFPYNRKTSKIGGS